MSEGADVEIDVTYAELVDTTVEGVELEAALVEGTETASPSVEGTEIPTLGSEGIEIYIPGIQGPPGNGDLNFPFEQDLPLTTWTVTHGLGKRPSVTVTSLAGKRARAEVTYLSDDAVQIDFASPFSGFAYFN